ncbi:hypothetical protein [Maritimibacter dapengensis]|uniref:Uncharacterized protein n=1 Tax=Maritimibacter dapengensis TaxID=2836868 RepID=A0ABS6T3H3_9RHOB|nr:hypothetical protein [Maritimibacter dapengensis]MBV7379778.1 hypothetical protein [Maritimibacter dapengensis]
MPQAIDLLFGECLKFQQRPFPNATFGMKFAMRDFAFTTGRAGNDLAMKADLALV